MILKLNWYFTVVLWVMLLCCGKELSPINKAASQGNTLLIVPGSKVEKLAGGFMFTEGPACDAEGNIYFSDIPNQRIYRWSVNGTLSLFLENTEWANGLGFDGNGVLIACLERGRALVSFDSRGNKTILADIYDNKRLNSTNDLWIDPDGGIYFTDPRYRIRPEQKLIGAMEQDGEHVYYLSWDRKNLTRVIDDLIRPNGIEGDNGRKRLYVIDNGANKTYMYTIKNNGILNDKKLFTSKGGDGMTIDAEGNVYLTTGGVTIFNPDGVEIMNIKVPEQTSNVCFGGKYRQTLFITAGTSLYAIRMRMKGL
ncbi:MAG: SMP-30/gluconolactonase/LRE family protein [Candidatus Latescibacter sp.]|nr:SMP-30/gluconolactonase/LRE family protein [Candidatus Latescibacter sp.]